MNGTPAAHRLACHARRGLSYVEVAIASVIAAVLIVAALQTVGASRRAQLEIHKHSIGHLLARDLLTEILQQGYSEPFEQSVFGPEPSEDTGGRDSFDDVDDYDSWSASPPEEKDGTDLTGLDNWTREVVVDFVDPDDLATIVGADQGVKRMTVTVRRGTAVAAVMEMIRTAEWNNLPSEQ
jgi:hypothetical protein